MCGITGYIGDGNAVAIALANLKRLEYRGYDSAGIAYPVCEHVNVVRAAGKIGNLERVLSAGAHDAHVAIAHTRWATHGRPSEGNAHPHLDCTRRVAVVHNGIIENYADLRADLIASGHKFTSETDTEVLAHLIEDEIGARTSAGGEKTTAAVAAAVRSALQRVRGSYAVAVISMDAPGALFVARKDSPLVIGLGENESFIASDITAVMSCTRQVLLLDDGDFAVVERAGPTITDLDGQPVERRIQPITWDDTAAEKGGYPHFMLKEIYDSPRTVRETLRGRITESNEVVFPGLPFSREDWARFRRIAIVGCGTAYHAGVVGKRLFEQLLRRPVEAAIASEFRYGDPLVDAETLVILISQSGETADTLAAMREARSRGATTLAIVNVEGSTLAREADAALFTQAGPEIGVASTKAYLAQLVALDLLAAFLGQQDAEHAPEASAIACALRTLPDLIERALRLEPDVALLAERLIGHTSFFYLGRGYDFAVSLEAALKLKEISYLHAEAYAAGEMKHGPLALVEPGVVIVGFCTQMRTVEKMASNLKEVKARDGTVLAVVREGGATPDCADAVIAVPGTLDPLMPVVSMVPMQLLAYHVARLKGCEIDQPRNLAKSVTVE